MKKLINSLIMASALLAAGCEKDNRDAPQAVISGRVAYQDQAVPVRNGMVELELWQPGYELFNKINVFVKQDGSFSVKIFDGDYKLTMLRNDGPWANNTDTINIQLRGSADVDMPVSPFFMIRNASFNRSGSTLNATCNIEQTAPGSSVEAMVLLLGSTTIVDDRNPVASAEVGAAQLNPLNEAQSASVTIPASLVDKGYFYARIGVRMSGREEWVYSPVQKIQ